MTQLHRVAEAMESVEEAVDKAERGETNPSDAIEQILKVKYTVKNAKIKKDIKQFYRSQLEVFFFSRQIARGRFK